MDCLARWRDSAVDELQLLLSLEDDDRRLRKAALGRGTTGGGRGGCAGALMPWERECVCEPPRPPCVCERVTETTVRVQYCSVLYQYGCTRV